MDDVHHLLSNIEKEELERVTKEKFDLTMKLYSKNLLNVNEDKAQILQVENTTTDLLDESGK